MCPVEPTCCESHGSDQAHSSGSSGSSIPSSSSQGTSASSSTGGSGSPPAAAKLQAAAQKKAWVFFIALSAHSVFDGLSLGSEQSLKGFNAILVAVLAHKAFDGIALGVPIYLAELPAGHTWALLVFCALSTPLGVGLGWAITSAGSHHSAATQALLTAIVVALSSGSFLYISIVELLPSALSDGRHQGAKLLCFFAGFLAMSVLAAYV